jgi:hypothetical protein
MDGSSSGARTKGIDDQELRAKGTDDDEPASLLLLAGRGLLREAVYAYSLVEIPIFALIVNEWRYFPEIDSSSLVQDLFVNVNADDFAKEQVVASYRNLLAEKAFHIHWTFSDEWGLYFLSRFRCKSCLGELVHIST